MQSPTWVAAQTVVNEFFKLHGYTLHKNDLSGPMPADQLTSDYINGHVSMFGYARLDGRHLGGQWLCVLIIPSESEHNNMYSIPKLRELLNTVIESGMSKTGNNSKNTKIIILAPHDFKSRKARVDEIALISKSFNSVPIMAYPIIVFMQNPMKHILNPQSKILSPEETAVMQIHICANANQLPCMKITDPVAIWLMAERGQVIRHDKVSNTSVATVEYNYVV